MTGLPSGYQEPDTTEFGQLLHEFRQLEAAIKDFIDQRPEYITALKNTRGDDSQADYYRWSGHAEARRQLAQKLGWTVPHEPGETTQEGAEQ